MKNCKRLIKPGIIIMIIALFSSCEKEETGDVASLNTLAVSEISTNTAKSGGNINHDGGYDITTRGVVWGKSANPTVEQHTGLTIDGSGAGIFVSNLTGLETDTEYYVRAYATNAKGIVYGDALNFKTHEAKTEPQVNTVGVSEISQTSLLAEGDVTDDGGETVTAFGFCWAQTPNPTLSSFFSVNGEGIGNFTGTISDLEPATKYYLRAYATNAIGTSYGDEIEFTTLKMTPWAQKPNFGGTARAFATGFDIGNKGYFATGFDVSNFTKDLWEFDINSNSWTQKAPFGGNARWLAVGFSINAKGYIATGSHAKDVWEYDYLTNTWTQKANYPGNAGFMAVGFAIGDKGYIGTGFDGTNNVKDFWQYDPSSNTWTQKADFPGIARRSAVGFNLENKGYIGTGIGEYGSMKDFWEYNPMNDTWTQKADFGGTARYDAVGFVINEKAYVGTGRETVSAVRKDFWEYNPIENQWVKKTDMPGPARWGATAFSIANKGYVGTGFDGNNDLRDFYEYDPQYDEP